MKIYWVATTGNGDAFETQYTFDIRRAFLDFASELEKVYAQNTRRHIRRIKQLEVTLFELDLEERLIEMVYKEQIAEYEEEYLDGSTFCFGENAEETMFFLWRYDIPTYDCTKCLVSIKTWER